LAAIGLVVCALALGVIPLMGNPLVPIAIKTDANKVKPNLLV
jgi:hypothetical protein